MPYNGTEGAIIPQPAARTLMDNYENSPAFPANNLVKGILFGKDHIDQILANPRCLGIRVYYGKEGVSSNDAPQLILVGYDEDGNDLVDTIVDAGLPCPTHCPQPGKGI